MGAYILPPPLRHGRRQRRTLLLICLLAYLVLSAPILACAPISAPSLLPSPLLLLILDVLQIF